MPRYTYHCEECEVFFQSNHSIKEKLVDCEECDSKGALKRVPSIPLILNKNQDKEEHQVGGLVKEYIEDVRETLEQEKRELKNQVYKDD